MEPPEVVFLLREASAAPRKLIHRGQRARTEQIKFSIRIAPADVSLCAASKLSTSISVFQRALIGKSDCTGAK